MSETQRHWSPAVFLLLIGGGAVLIGALGLINQKWGWVVLAAGIALIGLTYIVNIGTIRGPASVLFAEETYAQWSPWSRHLNTVGNVLVIAGVIVIWGQ